MSGESNVSDASYNRVFTTFRTQTQFDPQYDAIVDRFDDKNFINDEQGASMAEYAMLLALIAVATIGAVAALRTQIVSIFTNSAAQLGETP